MVRVYSSLGSNKRTETYEMECLSFSVSAEGVAVVHLDMVTSFPSSKVES